MSGLAYAKSRRFLEEENHTPTGRSSPIVRAAPAQNRKLLKKGVRAFVGGGDGSLARPLSSGMKYVAAIADFDELSERHIWDVTRENQTFITQEQVDAIFLAKCQDQKCQVSMDRAVRFRELMYEMCHGEWFSLRQCGLGIHSLRAVVDVLQQDDNITHLDLSGNTFGPDSGACLAQLLSANSSLCVLRLQSINIGDGIEPLMDALQNNNTLTALDLSGIAGITRNTIWGKSAESVAAMFSRNQVLSYLNLAHCGLQRSSVAIIRSCASHLALTKLNLSGNKIKDDGCRAIAYLLTSGVCSLQSLYLDENQITCLGVSTIGDALRTTGVVASNACLSLELISLNQNEIGASGLEVLCNSLKDHPKIATISLSHNKLCSMGVDEDGYRIPDSLKGLASLFSVVESSQTLQVIRMAYCNIDALPANLPQALHKTTSLQKLDMCENLFGNPGGLLLAEGLAKNRSLTHLDVAQCRMNECMSSIAASIGTHRRLTHLRINQGTWDVHGCGIIDALKQSQVVVSVDLGKDALDYVHSSLQRNKQLRVQNATPLLAEKQKELAHEEKLFQETQEFIVDEIKGREKTMDYIKALRDKQKVVAQQMKDELDNLKATVDQGNIQQESLQQQTATLEEQLNTRIRESDNEKAKIAKKTETAMQQRADFVLNMQKLQKQSEGRVGSPVSGELQKLELELRVAQQDSKDEQEACEILRAKLTEMKREIERLSSASSPAAAPVSTPVKKK